MAGRRQSVALVERKEDLRMQEEIRKRADYSLAVLGKAFVVNGSGRFLNIRTGVDSLDGKRKKKRTRPD